MPFRVTEAEVRAIIKISNRITDLTPFIESANMLVTEICEPVDTFDEDRLKVIEKWLSAHFVAIDDMRRSQESVQSAGGGASQSFQYKVGLNLAVTTYGQQAMLMDTSGGLAKLSKDAELGKGKRMIGVAWVGSTEEERRDGDY